MDIFSGCFEFKSSANSRKCATKSGSTAAATPLPKVKMSIILVLGFSTVFGSTVIYPFLPFMVQDFFPYLNKEEIGQKAGFLGSAYFVGNLVGSLVWGWLADTWGRRPVLILGSLGVISSALLFGFSQSFAMAVTTRLLWGLLNGTFISKTYLAEILDDSNQANGFSKYGMGSGLGRIFGYVVGGFLAQPASKYMLFQNSFFCQFQYILPVFVNVAVATIGLIGVVLTFEETLRHSSVEKLLPNDEYTGTNESESNVKKPLSMINDIENGDVAAAQPFGEDNETPVVSDKEPLLDDLTEHQKQTELLNETKCLYHPVKRFYKFQHDQCIECCRCLSLNNSSSDHSFSGCGEILSAKIKKEIVMRAKLLLDWKVALSVLTYAFIGGVTILSVEIYPLLLVTDHEHGGYNMDDNEISLFVMIAGISVLVYQVFAYSHIIKLVGYRNLLRISLIVFASGLILLPWANRITGPIEDAGTLEPTGSGIGVEIFENNTDIAGYCKFNYTVGGAILNEDSVTRLPARVWAVMLTSTLMIVIGRISCFVCTVILINNSATTEARGTVNGIGQSLFSVCRSLTPAMGSMAFAWSQVNGYSWPFNYHLLFELSAISSVAIALFTFLFPKSIEKRR